MLRRFLILAIRSSVAYRLCTARDLPRAPLGRLVEPLRRPAHA